MDVEGAELEVLRGIGASHWPIVRQVAAEVHGVGSRLQDVAALLRGQGFSVRIVRPDSGRLPHNHLVTGVRPARLPDTPASPFGRGACSTQNPCGSLPPVVATVGCRTQQTAL